MKEFSKSWISSKKPNKQRKYRFNAPLHIRGDFLNAHLSKELKTKYNMRSLRVRVGDKVKIMRGQFKSQEGKVEEVDTKRIKVYITKIEHVKRDGSKARYPIHPSNLLLVELNTDDKRRFGAHKKDKVAAQKVAKTEKVKVEPKVKVEKKDNVKSNVIKSKSDKKPKEVGK